MAITSLNSVNQLISVMVKCCVLFEVRTEFLNIIQTSFGFNLYQDAVRQRALQRMQSIQTTALHLNNGLMTIRILLTTESVRRTGPSCVGRSVGHCIICQCLLPEHFTARHTTRLPMKH
jgi:hypothetical protein